MKWWTWCGQCAAGWCSGSPILGRIPSAAQKPALRAEAPDSVGDTHNIGELALCQSRRSNRAWQEVASSTGFYPHSGR